MNKELIELLEKIHTANKCVTCGGNGVKPNRSIIGYVHGPDIMDEAKCPTCNGTGSKVPALDRTKSIYVHNPSIPGSEKIFGEIPRDHKLKYGYINPAYIFPSPTVEELLEMLPPAYLTEDANTTHFNRLTYKKYGEHEYGFGDIKKFRDKSPLIALLGLFLWWLNQEQPT